MDIDLARHVVRIAFRSSRELGGLLAVLKAHCGSEEEYERYARAIAASIASIQLKIVNQITASHPTLDAEIESIIAKYDRYL